MALLLNNSMLSYLRRQVSHNLKASTLIETLVATVIIVLIFGIASLTLNSIFKNTIQGNTQAIDNHLNKVLYLYQHQKIANDFTEDFYNWEVNLTTQIENNIEFAVLKATNNKTGKEIIKKSINAVGE